MSVTNYILVGINTFIASIISAFILLIIFIVLDIIFTLLPFLKSANLLKTIMGMIGKGGGNVSVGGIFISILIVNFIDQILPVFLIDFLGIFGVLLLWMGCLFLKIGEFLLLVILLNTFTHAFIESIIMGIVGFLLMGLINAWVGGILIPIYFAGFLSGILRF